jgi:hypothetical protein
MECITPAGKEEQQAAAHWLYNFLCLSCQVQHATEAYCTPCQHSLRVPHNILDFSVLHAFVSPSFGHRASTNKTGLVTEQHLMPFLSSFLARSLNQFSLRVRWIGMRGRHKNGR